jgi:hypothetical protein
MTSVGVAEPGNGQGGEAVSGTLIVIAPDEPRARALARGDAYEHGWAQVRVTLTPMPWGGIPAPLTKGLPQSRWMAHLTGQKRVSAPSNTWAWSYATHVKAGARVRTRTSGENWAGGTRHTMPPGSVGVIIRRVGRGPHVRVAFPEVPGRTFIYSPDSLEFLDRAKP